MSIMLRLYSVLVVSVLDCRDVGVRCTDMDDVTASQELMMIESGMLDNGKLDPVEKLGPLVKIVSSGDGTAEAEDMVSNSDDAVETRV